MYFDNHFLYLIKSTRQLHLLLSHQFRNPKDDGGKRKTERNEKQATN